MTDALKFSWIVLCFCVAGLSCFRCVSKSNWAFLFAGMAFTLLSDYFLVLYDNQSAGVPLFCFVHVFYFLRAAPLKYAWIPAATIFCAAALLIFTGAFTVAAGLYACLFVGDIAANLRAFTNKANTTPRINRALTLAGIVLFALCDINVLLYNLPRYCNAPAWLAQAGYRLIWVFYAPAQLLLAVSAYDYQKGVLLNHGEKQTEPR